MLCAVEGETSIMAWSVDDAALYVARDEGGSLADLYDWWLDNHARFGPDPRADFPSLDELRLIAALPSETDPDCGPGDGRLLPTRIGPQVKPRAHVRCRLLGGAGPDVIEVFDVTTGSDVRAWDVIDAFALEQSAADGPCEGGGAMVDDWEAEGEAGRVVCYEDPESGETVVTWSQGDVVIYRAVATDGDRSELVRWWRENAGAMAP